MRGKSRLAAALAALAFGAAPASASLDSAFDLMRGAGSSAVVAPGASSPQEARAPRMPDAASRGVLVREGAFTICTDGRIEDTRRARQLGGRDSTRRGGTSLTAGGRVLDPDRIPYFVLPRGFGSAGLGDLALVTYDRRSAWAVAGDQGPCEGCIVGKKHKHPYLFGEGSTALARALAIPGADNGDRGGVSSGVTFLIFPGTAPKEGFRGEADLQRHLKETGAALYERYFAPERRQRAALLGR